MIAEHGEFLANVESRWTDQRREELLHIATEARYEAAELAFELGMLAQADNLSRQVLDAEPLRESGWRLTMKIANALGDEDGIITAYQGCERALAAVATTPSGSTRQLLETLRR